ncbi:hypothetical protein [Bremerella cremea]|nr:hypothetical protein [Bremerella cremea]
MTPIEIVQQAVANPNRFQEIACQLSEFAPDFEATRWLCQAYRAGQVTAAEAAYLLGLLRHAAGYDTAKEILQGNFRHASEKYAGEAMFLIRGQDAYHDLRSLMLEHPHILVRQGAASGLALFHTADIVPDFLQAFYEGKLWPKDVAFHVAGCHPSEEQLLSLLLAEDEQAQALGLHIVEPLIAAENLPHCPGEPVKKEVARLLAAPAFRPKRKHVRSLYLWATGQKTLRNNY